MFYIRVVSARKKLKEDGLLEDPEHGMFRITKLGRRELLRQREEGSDADEGQSSPKEEPPIPPVTPEEGSDADEGQSSPKEEPPIPPVTPEEALHDAYEALRNSLTANLLAQVRESSPAFFELLVVDVLVSMGYGGSRKDAGEAIGRSGDEGIDGIIKEDRLGLDIIYIQAKRWASTVGRPEVQRFAGALQGKRARKGVFITTSSFSREAEKYVGNIEAKVILIDGKRLAEFMIDYGVGVRTEATYELKRIDADYFPKR
jgi:restriction system protein